MAKKIKPSDKDSYVTELRKVRAILIATSLKESPDVLAYQEVASFSGKIEWSSRANFAIDEGAWNYIVKTLNRDPRLIFCHPEVLLSNPRTSLYYRGLSTLSLKAIRDYAGSVDAIEEGSKSKSLTPDRALKLARAYNQFISSVVLAVDNWQLEDGHRAIIATIGITLDGAMRNKIGEEAESHVRKIIVDGAVELGIVDTKNVTLVNGKLPKRIKLKDEAEMIFGSEPDVSFYKIEGDQRKLVCIVEIKGGTDPAGALERYGAATKSFQSALFENSRCQNYFLAAAYTDELTRRISEDRLVHKYFNIIKLLAEKDERDVLLREIFHFTLRIV